MSTATASHASVASDQRFQGLSHVAIACADLSASLQFYTNVLGYAEHCRLNYQGTDRLMLVCLKISDDQWLELFDGRNLPAGVPALHQVAVRTSSAEDCRARLATFGHPVPDRVWQGQMRNFGFTTPDPREVTIEFVEATGESWMTRDRGQFLPAERISSRIIEAGIAGPVDSAAVQSFYGECLGLGVTVASDGTWTVPVAPVNGQGPVERIVGDPRATAAWFTLQVANLEDVQARLGRTSGEIPVIPVIATTRQITLRDPDGMLIHLVAA